jgi:hypothetical protein
METPSSQPAPLLPPYCKLVLHMAQRLELTTAGAAGLVSEFHRYKQYASDKKKALSQSSEVPDFFENYSTFNLEGVCWQLLKLNVDSPLLTVGIVLMPFALLAWALIVIFHAVLS